MTTQSSGTTSKQPAWHPHYDDGSADIVFISNDGIKFGMSLKLLAKTRYDSLRERKSNELTFKAASSLVC